MTWFWQNAAILDTRWAVVHTSLPRMLFLSTSGPLSCRLPVHNWFSALPPNRIRRCFRKLQTSFFREPKTMKVLALLTIALVMAFAVTNVQAGGPPQWQPPAMQQVNYLCKYYQAPWIYKALRSFSNASCMKFCHGKIPFQRDVTFWERNFGNSICYCYGARATRSLQTGSTNCGRISGGI